MSEFFFSFSGLKHIFTSLLRPMDLYPVVEAIPIEEYLGKGYKNLILDIDNTLMPYDQKTISLQKRSWVKKAQASGFYTLLISNNSSHKRIERVGKELEIQGLHFAMKPFAYSVRELLADHGLKAEETLIVGDQLFTDVILGNWLGMGTILVDPIDKKSFFLKTLQRDIELFLLRHIR